MSESSPFPEYMDAQQGAKKKAKTHRGRRSKGKGAKPAADHMATANQHIQNAHKAPDKKTTTAHLFKALGALKKAQ